MNRIKIPEILTQTGLKPIELGRLLWPDANTHTQRSLISKWMTNPPISIRLDQLQVLLDLMGTTNITNVIEFGDETPTNATR